MSEFLNNLVLEVHQQNKMKDIILEALGIHTSCSVIHDEMQTIVTHPTKEEWPSKFEALIEILER